MNGLTFGLQALAVLALLASAVGLLLINDPHGALSLACCALAVGGCCYAQHRYGEA